jgi:hypothetical protein
MYRAGARQPPQGSREEFVGIHLSAVPSQKEPRTLLALSTLLDDLPWHKSCLGANTELEARDSESLLLRRRLHYQMR